MTAAQLIAILQTVPPDAEVLIGPESTWEPPHPECPGGTMGDPPRRAWALPPRFIVDNRGSVILTRDRTE